MNSYAEEKVARDWSKAAGNTREYNRLEHEKYQQNYREKTRKEAALKRTIALLQGLHFPPKIDPNKEDDKIIFY